jgi:hypothetical protein
VLTLYNIGSDPVLLTRDDGATSTAGQSLPDRPGASYVTRYAQIPQTGAANSWTMTATLRAMARCRGTATDAARDRRRGNGSGSLSDCSLRFTPLLQQRHPGHPKFWAYVTVSGGTPTLSDVIQRHQRSPIPATGVLTVTIATDFSDCHLVAACLVPAEANHGQHHLAAPTAGSPLYALARMRLAPFARDCT